MQPAHASPLPEGQLEYKAAMAACSSTAWKVCVVGMFREVKLHSILRVENTHCFVSWLKMSSLFFLLEM